MKFKLVDKHPVTSDVVLFVFEFEQPVTWLPGQYFHYVLRIQTPPAVVPSAGSPTRLRQEWVMS